MTNKSTNKSIRDYINLIENAQREEVAEAGNGRPGTTPGFNDTLSADEKRREQRSQERKAQDKSTMQGINKSRAKADAYRKSGVAEDSIGMEKLKQDRKAKEEWIKNNPLMKGKNPVEQQAAWAIYSTFHKPNADKKQGAPDEQLEETSPEAIAKINQLTRR